MSSLNKVSKRDAFHMTPEQVRAGRLMEAKMKGPDGRLMKSSNLAEDTAPKTWILFKDAHRGEEVSTIECEIYSVPRASNANEMVAMLIGMCPKCSEHFTVREDNKTMSVGWVKYSQLKPSNHLRVNWEYHCKNVLSRRPKDDDEIAVVSSPERWLCDYCHGWCVKVSDSIAITDMSGATQMYAHQRAGSSILEAKK